MKKTQRQDSDSFSYKTTKTMREKAQVVSRCVINMLKFWRICCRPKKTRNVAHESKSQKYDFSWGNRDCGVPDTSPENDLSKFWKKFVPGVLRKNSPRATVPGHVAHDVAHGIGMSRMDPVVGGVAHLEISNL